MINQGSYKPVINRSPDERPVASNALKNQFNATKQQQPKQQNQSENNSEEQCAMSGGVWDAQSNSCVSKRDAQALEQKRSFEDRERLVKSDPNSGSKNFGDKKYSPSSQGKLEGIDAMRQANQSNKLNSYQSINPLRPKSLSLEDFNSFLKNRTPQDVEIDRIRSMRERGVPMFSGSY